MYKGTKMDIEKLATSEVIASISETDYLSASINSDDKEPSWDGHIYVYNNKNKKKNDVVRVPVQVKGKLCTNISKSKITHPVEMSDLKNYYNDGGVIFFVVLIQKDTFAKKIFYADLLPVKLKPLLSDKKKQTIEFKKFPSENKQKQAIFRNFDNNSKKQASFTKSDSFLPLKVLKTQADNIEKITTTLFEASDDDRKDPIQMLFKSELYFYANLKESNIPQPLDTPLSVFQTHEQIPVPIFVGGIQFYSDFSRIRSRSDTVVKIGKSLTMDFEKGKIDFKLADNLRDAVVDLDFFIQIILSESFQIDNMQIPLNSDDFKSFNVPQEQIFLSNLKNILQVLDYLNIKDDINISELTDKDKKNLAELIVAFVDKKTVSGIHSKSPLVFMQILKFKLLLYFAPDENNLKNVEIHDFFQMPDMLVKMTYKNGKETFASQYVILNKEDYLKYSNVRYDSVLKSFQRCYSDDSPTMLIDGANKVLLDLLYVYDVCNEKKSEVLCAAKDLAEWILEKNNTVISQLNLLQTIRREREFTKSEKEMLLSIVLDNQNREDVLFGANLLLDNQELAAKYFEQLDSATQETYKQYPIYRFSKF